MVPPPPHPFPKNSQRVEMHHRGVPPSLFLLYAPKLPSTEMEEVEGRTKGFCDASKTFIPASVRHSKSSLLVFFFPFFVSHLCQIACCVHIQRLNPWHFGAPISITETFLSIIFFSVFRVQILNHEYPQPHAYGRKEKRVQTHRQSTKDLMNLSPQPLPNGFPPILSFIPNCTRRKKWERSVVLLDP